MNFSYLVHDLSDPAVAKRVQMLITGGARVRLGGFRRSEAPIKIVEGVAAFDLGRTYDKQLTQRAAAALTWVLTPWRLAAVVRQADVIAVRNLEVLVIAATVRALYAPRARLVYECLDIHPSMLQRSLRGWLLRAVERMLLRRCALLIVSSPGFVENYFKPWQNIRTPILMLENKALVLSGAPARPPGSALRRHSAPPWRIGWFGILRTQKALDVLCAIAQARAGHVEIIIRGRPAWSDFTDFIGQIDRTPGVSFAGAYTPAELGDIYEDIHFCWALDFLDEDGNSNWLLPNRLYEGGRFQTVPIALRGSQTAVWLEALGFGVIVNDPIDGTVDALDAMTPSLYMQRRREAAAVDPKAFIADAQDCFALVAAMSGQPG